VSKRNTAELPFGQILPVTSKITWLKGEKLNACCNFGCENKSNLLGMWNLGIPRA